MPIYFYRSLRIYICGFLAFMLLSQNACAKNYYEMIKMVDNNFPFKHLGMKEGLSGNYIYGIERDSRGLVWIATYYGLNSFDGYRVKTYPTTRGTMPISKALAVDQNDNVWLLSYDSLYVLRPLQKSRFGENPMLLSILPEEATGGRCREKIEGMKKTPKHGIMMWDSKMLSFMEKDGLIIKFDELISDVCDQNDGNGVLAITQSGKVVLVNENGEKVVLTSLIANGNTLRIYQDNKHRIWVYQTEARSIHCLNIYGEETEKDLVRTIAQVAPITHILENGTDLYFCTNNDGLVILDAAERLTNLRSDEQTPFSLPSNHLSVAYIDRYAKLWLGTSKMGIGLASLNPLTPHRNIVKVKEDVSCFGETSDGQLIIGYDGGGLQIGDRLLTTTNSSLPVDVTVEMCSAQDGFYIGTYGGGLLHMDKDGRNVKSLIFDSDSLASCLDKVGCCIEDKYRRLWVGTFRDGLYLIEKQPSGAYSLIYHFNIHNSEMRTDCVTSMDITPDGTAIVVATSTGLYLVDIETLKLKALDRETDFRCTLVDQQGLIWAGTHNGLIHLDEDGNKIELNIHDQALAGEIIGLAQDKNGTVFAMSPYTLSMIFPQAYGNYFVYTNSSGNGLGNMIFMRNSIYCCSDGKVIVGGNACYASFYPNITNNYGLGQKVQITSMVLDGKEVYEVSDYIPKKHSITLEVSDMSCWGDVQYEYRLDRGEWMSAIDNHIVLGHLIPGRYCVDVRKINGTDDTIESISFRVGKWWEHWIFELSVLLTIILCAIFGIRKMIRKIQSVKPFHVSATNDEAEAPDAKMLKRVAQIIEENIANEKFSVEELADNIGMSRSNLFRRLKALTGQTPIELIQDMRFQKAKQKLAQSGASISQVSYEVGLTPRQLTALFKKKFGKTPSQAIEEKELE